MRIRYELESRTIRFVLNISMSTFETRQNLLVLSIWEIPEIEVKWHTEFKIQAEWRNITVQFVFYQGSTLTYIQARNTAFQRLLHSSWISIYVYGHLSIGQRHFTFTHSKELQMTCLKITYEGPRAFTLYLPLDQKFPNYLKKKHKYSTNSYLLK